jgi:hypothetical protein
MSFDAVIDDAGIFGVLAAMDRNLGTEVSTRFQLRAAQQVTGEIRREIAGWTSRTSTAKTGGLARSWSPVFRTSGGVKEIGVFSDSPYARIHEHGGEITPKAARALTIPLTPTARRRSARDWKDLKLIHRPPFLPILATVRKGKIQPQYVLKNRVFITPKRYLTKAGEKVEPDLKELAIRTIKKAFKDAAKRAR